MGNHKRTWSSPLLRQSAPLQHSTSAEFHKHVEQREQNEAGRSELCFVIRDNFSFHRAAAIGYWYSDHSRCSTMFLPVYIANFSSPQNSSQYGGGRFIIQIALYLCKGPMIKIHYHSLATKQATLA